MIAFASLLDTLVWRPQKEPQDSPFRLSGGAHTKPFVRRSPRRPGILAFAWNGKGHFIVCRLAWLQLTDRQAAGRAGCGWTFGIVESGHGAN